MKKDMFVRVLLITIAVLLLMNLFSGHISSVFAPEAVARSEAAKSLAFRGNGIGITCSSNGQHVFAAGNGIILRSSDYGRAGSWEAVVD